MGVTLTELLVTLSIVTTALVVGVPSFASLQTKTQRSSVMLELVSSLALARSESAARRADVTLCPTSDGASCLAGANPQWKTGWLIFLDANANRSIDPGEQVLHAYQVEHADFSLQGAGAIASGVTFRSDGFPVAAGSLSYCDDAESRTVALNLIGHVQVDSTAGGCP